jgi:cytochrome c oxidase subunit IV
MMTLTKLFSLYQGRTSIPPVEIDSQESFVAHLEENATRVESLGTLLSPWYGYLGRGYFFYQQEKTIVIRFKWRLRRSSWRFEGEMSGQSPECQLTGQFKVSAFHEWLSNLALILAAVGLLVTAYFYMVGQPDQLSWAPYLILLPIMIFVVRWVGSGEMNIGHNVISAIKALFDFMNARSLPLYANRQFC